LYRLYHTVLDIRVLHETLLQHTVICDYLFEKDSNMKGSIETILDTLHGTLLIEDCASLNHYKFEHNIIQPNISVELDKWMKKYQECENLFSQH